MYLLIITTRRHHVWFGYQVIRGVLRTLTRRQPSESSIFRSASSLNVTDPQMFRLEKLTNRGLLKISGSDSFEFLQGMVTNDMGRLKSRNSIFSLFLNINGRIMYDAIIYKTNVSETFLIEVDAGALNRLQKHLKMYRVRRAVNVSPVDDLAVWVLYNPLLIEKLYQLCSSFEEDITVEKYVSCIKCYPSAPTVDQLPQNNNDLLVYRDPRLSALGVRIISSVTTKPEDQLKDISLVVDTAHLYRNNRFKLGICEGLSEIPFGQCFPFDVNADYLNGVSFNKGCYIGQELTARTYHIGVVRKRIMPVLIDTSKRHNIELGMSIEYLVGKNKLQLGKLLAVDKSIGLALVRVKEALAFKVLIAGNCSIRALQPVWWPIEFPKSKN